MIYGWFFVWNLAGSFQSNTSYRPNWFDASVDKSFEGLVQKTEQRYWSITFWVLFGVYQLWDCDDKQFSSNIKNFESRNREKRNHITWTSKHCSLAGYKLWADGTTSRSFTMFSMFQGSSEFSLRNSQRYSPRLVF